MDDLKVALVSHEFPPFAIGGIASNCYDLAYSLSKRKIDTVVICGRSAHTRVEKPNDFLKIVRLPYFDIPPRYFWFQLQNSRAISNFVRDRTIIHGVNPISSAICAYYSRKTGKPLVVTCHHSGLQELKEFMSLSAAEWTIGNLGISFFSFPLNEFLIKMCTKNANSIVVPGLSTLNYMKKHSRNLNSRNISVIYNGINFDKISKITNEQYEDFEKKLSGQETSLSIVFYGRLVSTKGIMYLIDAVAFLAREFPDLHLDILGKGPLEHKIKLRIRNLGLKSRVKLFGYVPYRELIKQINKASIVVLPSLVEVGPFIAALEAMACKKPLVVFDFPFTREFISNMCNGIFAKAGDAKDLSDKIRVLLTDKKMRHKIGENAYDYVRKNHNWDDIVKKYIEVYEKVHDQASRNCRTHLVNTI